LRWHGLRRRRSIDAVVSHTTGRLHFFAALLPLVLSAPLRALPPDNEPASPQPIPLPYTLRDDAGTSLAVNADGSVTDGQGDLFDAGAQLFVGPNFQYAPDVAQVMFDRRRDELVFPPMPGPGLSVSRRVSVNGRAGWWRFVEVLENGGGQRVRTQVRVRHNLSNPVQAVEQVADEGRGGKPRGVCVFDGDDAIAVMAAGRGAGAQPQLLAQAQGDSIDVLYDLDVPPRKTVTLVHFLAVRPSTDAAVQFLRTAKDSELLRGLPPEVLASVVNFSTSRRLVGDVEVLRGELFDVVELRGGDVVKGTLRERSYAIQTPYATVELPAERVVAMVTLGQFRPTQLLVTADGEVFGGTLRNDTVRLELASGQVTSVPIGSLRRFGYRRRPGEPEDLRPPPAKPLVVLRAGDRLVVEPPGDALPIATCYGVLRLDPRHVASLAFQSDEQAVHEVRLVDGSHFAGVVPLEKLDVKLTGAATQSVSFPLASLARLQFAADVEELADGAPQLELANGDLFVGTLAGTITMETEFNAVEVEAEGLRAAQGRGAGEVQLTLWDGTTLSGRVRGESLDCTLRCGAAMKVPAAMLKRYHQPSPRPAPAVVEHIKAVVAELNADDWKARDRAAGQLASIGPAAAAVLKELRERQPPEVRQRIDQILVGFEAKSQAPPPATGDVPVEPAAPGGGR
jgi:hypothetical protein